MALVRGSSRLSNPSPPSSLYIAGPSRAVGSGVRSVTLSDPERLAPMGVVGPLVFLVGVILVSWSERDFMAELGWDQWPSGTALGPHGWATVLVFLLTGACQIIFGWVLFAQAGESWVRKIGASLLVLSSLGLAVLAFKTDAEGAEQTWHGLFHVIGYMTFFVPLLLAYVFLTWGSWGRFSRSSWRFAPLALVPLLGALALPDELEASNYLFFAVLFIPLLVLAIRVLDEGGWPASRAS
jgi:Protein of unknown function (DUF998)